MPEDLQHTKETISDLIVRSEDLELLHFLLSLLVLESVAE